MAQNPNSFMGLGDFGLTAPSQASSVDDALGLDELLKGNMLDDTAKAKALESSIAQTQGIDTGGILDQLLSPRGLIALLGTAGAGMLGGAPAAAGFGLGALGGASERSLALDSAKRRSIKDLQDQLTATQERLDKSQQRVATLFNTNPEAFVDPVTGEQRLSPEVLGFFATGSPIELFATSRRAANRRDTQWEKRYALLSDRLEKTPDLADRRVLTQGLLHLLDFPQSNDIVEALSAAPAEKFPSEIASMYLKYGGETGMQAIIKSGEEGKPLWHPDIARLIQYRDPDGTGKRTPADKFLELATEITAWSSDPANLDKMREIRSANDKKGEGAVSIAIAREVLGGRRGDFDIYLDEAELRGSDDTARILAQYKMLQDQYQLGVGLSGLDKTDFIRGMSDEERAGWMWNNAQQSASAQEQIARDTQAKQDVAAAGGVVKRLQSEVGAGPNEAATAAQQIMLTALRRATRPDGSVDKARYEQEIKRVTDEVVAGLKAE